MNMHLLNSCIMIYLQILFEAMDANKDGVISKEEYLYSHLDFYFHSDPDNMNSLFFGNLPNAE